MLDIQNLSKTFNPGTVNEKKALSSLSLHLDEGDFVTIVGSNGAGKSTLFNAIAGSFYADEGSISLAGKDITFMPEHERSRRHRASLSRTPCRGTRAEHDDRRKPCARVTCARRTAIRSAASAKKDKDFFVEQLKQLDMGLEDRMKNPVGLLSGGQRQALTLLMATMVPPQLLLLDEHTAALDPATAEKVLDLTRRVVAECHIICLMVTHNMHQALELGNRTLMMADGHIVLDIAGSERAGMGVDDLIARFKAGAGHELDNDRILLSE